MVYPGYLTIGLDDPLDPPYPEAYEITNNNRALAYAAWAGINWLSDCDECEIIGPVLSDGGVYVSPVADPAPWYHGQRPASAEFLGVIGLQLDGAENSTRTASVTLAGRPKSNSSLITARVVRPV